MSKLMLSAQIEKEFEWGKWQNEIPSIQFPPTWKIQIIPPFSGAVVRFVVRPETISSFKDAIENDIYVSVYLDCYNNLGFFGEPYWEIYPDKNDENSRFKMADIKNLLKAIDQSLKVQLKRKSKK